MKGKFSKKTTGLLIVIAILIAAAANSFAWYGPYFHPNGKYEDIHKSDTVKWAVEAGMGTLSAAKVGDSDAMVDILFKLDLKWHLDRSKFTSDSEDTRVIQSRNELTNAKRKLDEAAMNKQLMDSSSSKWDKVKYLAKLNLARDSALTYMGRSLHPVQDIYAHMDAGINKPDSAIGLSHGMLDADPVDVKVIYPDGSTESRKMKLEEKDRFGFDYSLYDDVNYDYDGGWIFRVNGKKEDNKRWQATKDASIALIKEFLSYGSQKGIFFN